MPPTVCAEDARSLPVTPWELGLWEPTQENTGIQMTASAVSDNILCLQPSGLVFSTCTHEAVAGRPVRLQVG